MVNVISNRCLILSSRSIPYLRPLCLGYHHRSCYSCSSAAMVEFVVDIEWICSRSFISNRNSHLSVAMDYPNTVHIGMLGSNKKLNI